MKRFQLTNNVLGWLVFLVAAFTYCATVEPTASFWDCPEFTTTAYKLEVGHPPGAPFFMLTANFFTLFASQPEQVALCVNIMSALMSALCVLFLFWTVTHLARKLICPEGVPATTGQMVLVMACGVCGALAYAWSDTFWFSAVEGEVYAYSSMITALVFWLILKWEDHADEPRSDRYLVLIFYITGLSIGVHLLGLLCLPAIALVYYYRLRPQATAAGSLLALAISLVLVAAVLYGVVPGIVKVGGWSELFFVNVVGMPFNAGLIIYLVVLIAVMLLAIRSTSGSNRTLMTVLYAASVLLLGVPFLMGRSALALVVGLLLTAALVWLLRCRNKSGQYVLRKRFLNTSLLCMLMLMIGYSSYAVIVIRSTQNTPMDQNSPEDVFTLGVYMGREQYGDTPLFYGPTYASVPCFQRQTTTDPVTGAQRFVTYTDRYGQPQYALSVMSEKSTRLQRHEKKTPDEPDRYDSFEEMADVKYPSEMKMLLPRLYSQSHADRYEQWLGGESNVTKRYVTATWDTPFGPEESEAYLPSRGANLRYFLSYQVNFMYWRYFMWNFAGRQNDLQGNGEPEHGNWITGFDFIDDKLYGDQDKLPDALRDNAGRNVFYCLPLLLGILGLFWQAFRGQRGVQQFWIVFFLFFMTGLAIVLYLNQTPSQPRERDYAYAGSFYAFAIWIGLGVAALATWLTALARRLGKAQYERWAVVVAAVVALAVPLQMVSQTWDDHDRSDRYACRDFGLNYLNTLPDEGMPIIFTNGDNDTFPLWYAQEVEGKRTDARVCNLSYLQTDWYTDQMRRQAYESEPLPIAWSRYEYVDNRGRGFDYYEVRPELRAELDSIKARTGVDTYELSYVIDHYVRGRVANDQPGVMPTDSVVVSVDRDAIIRSGMMLPYGPDSIPEHMTISFRGKNSITKSHMMIYEMLARNGWKRPMYMSVTLGGLGSNNFAGLDDYLVLEGLAYRITPFRHEREANGRPRTVIDSERMFSNMMTRYRYGQVNTPGIYLDETVSRMCSTHRNMFVVLARQLLSEGKKDKALAALRKCKEVLPAANIPYDTYDYELAELWLRAGDKAEAARVAQAVGDRALQTLAWIGTLGDERMYGRVDESYRYFQVAYEAYDLLQRSDEQAASLFAQRLHMAENSEVGSMVLQWIQRQNEQYYAPAQPSFDFSGMGAF